jgi:REP element-mobilizing transposase RayT
MSRWHNQHLDALPHFCTATVADWRPLLNAESIPIVYREWAAARCRFGVKVLAYVVMPDHFHAVLWAESGENVCKFLQRTLALTSRAFQRGGGFWKERPRVLPIRSTNLLRTKVAYLDANPVRRRLVADAADWTDSSYRQLVLALPAAVFECDDWEHIPL